MQFPASDSEDDDADSGADYGGFPAIPEYLTSLSKQKQKQIMIGYMFLDSIQQQQLLVMEDMDLLVSVHS